MGCETSSCRACNNITETKQDEFEISLTKQKSNSKENINLSHTIEKSIQHTRSPIKTFSEEVFSSEDISVEHSTLQSGSMPGDTKTETYLQKFKEQTLDNLMNHALKELKIQTVSDIEDSGIRRRINGS